MVESLPVGHAKVASNTPHDRRLERSLTKEVRPLDVSMKVGLCRRDPHSLCGQHTHESTFHSRGLSWMEASVRRYHLLI